MGARSRAAAQILTGQGFKTVYNLKGGIKAWKGHEVEGPATMGMALLKGNERPAEIISLAYGMEEALRQFYTSSAKAIDDPDVSALLMQLAAIEADHKDFLFSWYQSMEDTSVDRENFEADVVASHIEGGFTADDLWSPSRSEGATTAGVLSQAMMLEAQAMDLYLRYAHMRKDPEGQRTLFKIADQEKAHLNSLGDLLEQKI